MKTPLKILIAEDSQDDTEILMAELRDAGFTPVWRRVECEKDFVAELEKSPDIILSDYLMPQFDGLRAARLLHASGLDIPFILVSGTVGEDIAVEAMRNGATDYLLKDRLTRLGQAVHRALREARNRAERKRAQNELVWKTAFLEAQVNSALDAILVVNDQSKRILQNDRLFQLFEVPEPITRNNDDAVLLQHVLTKVRNPEHFRRRVEELYAHPDEVGRDEVELNNGTVLDRYSAPVRDKAGKYYGRIWTFRDVTEQKQLEEQLRQAQKMEAIGQLAGGVAHDFNNILAVIQMQADMRLLEDHLAPAESDFVAEISKAAKRAANLTRQLLLFSRRQTLQPKDVDLNEIVISMTKMLNRILREDVQIEIKYSPQPLVIHADPGMIEQILMNLSVNSCDAMPKGGRLTVETFAVDLDESGSKKLPQSRPGIFACLKVTDSGVGIPPQVLPKIFEPFFTTKGVGKGTGLGLATVFGIVQQHEGWIHVDSKPDVGTAMTIYLPRLRRASEKAETLKLNFPRGNQETILLVEDSADLRDVFRAVLSELGYHVLLAATGVAALEIWKHNQHQIRLLITDLIMPDGMNGKELAKELLRQNPKLKVLYTSGYSADIAEKDFPLEEGKNFLPKPFEIPKLAQMVRWSLDL